MGFELPLWLLGLAAIGIPVIAHFLRRRDLRPLDLPTVELLVRAQAQQRRRIRIVDLLLLLLRILMVAALVLALSRPFVSMARPDAPESIVFVLDDSMSMFALESGESRFAKALGRLRDRLDDLSGHSDAALVLAGTPPRIVADFEVPRASLLATLNSLPDASARRSSFRDAMPLAAQLLRGSDRRRPRIVVFSDFAADNLLAEDEDLSQGFAVEWNSVAEANNLPNLWISRLVSSADPTTPGELGVELSVRCSNLDPEATYSATVEYETEIRSAGVISNCEESTTLRFHVPATESAEQFATIRIDAADALRLDNERSFLRTPTSPVRLLLVNGDPEPRLVDDELGFFRRALVHAARSDHNFAWHTVDEDTLTTTNLEATDVVVVANARAIGDSAARLSRFLERGGGILIAPGDRLGDRELLDWHLFPQSLSLELASGPAEPGVALVSEWFGAGVSGLEHTEVSERLLARDSGSDGEVAAQFSDGSTALLAYDHRTGKVALLTTALDDDWSDLPYRPGYLSLVARLIDWLAPAEATQIRSVAAGTPVSLAAGTTVTSPSERIVVVGDQPFTETDQPGGYQVHGRRHADSDTDASDWAFVVEPPSTESDLRAGYVPPSNTSEDLGSDEAAHEEVPLSPWLLFGFGVLFLLEAIARNRWRGTA